MLFIFSENFWVIVEKTNTTLTINRYHQILASCAQPFYFSKLPLEALVIRENQVCVFNSLRFYSTFPMKYILHSYMKLPTQPGSFWTNKIKLVLFVVLFCKQKALETLGFTHGKLGEMYSLILTQ